MTPRPRCRFLQLPPSGLSSSTLAVGASLQQQLWAPEWPPCLPEEEWCYTWSASPGVPGWLPSTGSMSTGSPRQALCGEETH